MLGKWYQKTFVDLGLLVLRLASGLFLAFGHGLAKLQGFDDRFHTFANPIGVGAELSYVLAVGAEFFCALLVVLGLFTRLATIPILILFSVIFFIVHGDDPVGKKELIVLFFASFLALFLAGPGAYSLDRLWRKKNL